jgi:chromosome segregation ATPase
MYQVQEAFERQKDEEARRLEMFNNKEEELRARDLAVQEKFVEFSKVINENEAKLQRARNRIEEENKAIEAKQKRKKELQDRVSELKNKANHLEQTVQAMKVYEEYLETVKNKYPEEYTDISDILGLELKLSNANQQLKAKQKTLEDMNGDLRKAKDHLETRKKNEIMLLNIDIAQRSKQCEDIEAKRIDLTKLLEQMSAKSVYKQVEIGHIFM